MKPFTVFSAAIRNTHTVAALALFVAAFASPLAQSQTYSVLHTFTSGLSDGAIPNALYRGAHGIMYGTTEGGGVPCGSGSCGTVYKIDSSGNETVIYEFRGRGDGATPLASVIQDAAGNIYGNTQGDGDIPADSTVFKIDPSGNETVLYDFAAGGHGCCQDSK